MARIADGADDAHEDVDDSGDDDDDDGDDEDDDGTDCFLWFYLHVRKYHARLHATAAQQPHLVISAWELCRPEAAHYTLHCTGTLNLPLGCSHLEVFLDELPHFLEAPHG